LKSNQSLPGHGGQRRLRGKRNRSDWRHAAIVLMCVEGFGEPARFATNGKSHYSDLAKL
jgi:hypothetical protein